LRQNAFFIIRERGGIPWDTCGGENENENVKMVAVYAAGNLTGLVDASNNLSTFANDALNRTISLSEEEKGAGQSALQTSVAGPTEVGAQVEREGLNEWPPLNGTSLK
jgi:hypothetical protein